MNTGMIPVRYAKALLEFAYEKGCADQLYHQMSAVADSFRRESSLRRVLDNPVLTPRVKADLIVSATGETAPGEVFSRFVKLILDHHRENYLQSMSLMYLDLYRKRNHISIGKLETAVSITPQTEERIVRLMSRQTQGKAELTTTVNPSLIGGFIFEMNCERLDASIVSQLHRVEKQFIEKNKRIV